MLNYYRDDSSKAFAEYEDYLRELEERGREEYAREREEREAFETEDIVQVMSEDEWNEMSIRDLDQQWKATTPEPFNDKEIFSL